MSLIPNREKLQALIKEQGLDAMIAMSPENFAYVAGWWQKVISQPTYRHSPSEPVVGMLRA